MTAEEAVAAAAAEGLPLIRLPGTKSGFKSVTRENGSHLCYVVRLWRGDDATRDLGRYATAEEAALTYARCLGRAAALETEASINAALAEKEGEPRTVDEVLRQAKAEGLELIESAKSATGYSGVVVQRNGWFGAQFADSVTRKTTWLGNYRLKEDAALAHARFKAGRPAMGTTMGSGPPGLRRARQRSARLPPCAAARWWRRRRRRRQRLQRRRWSRPVAKRWQTKRRQTKRGMGMLGLQQAGEVKKCSYCCKKLSVAFFATNPKTNALYSKCEVCRPKHLATSHASVNNAENQRRSAAKYQARVMAKRHSSGTKRSTERVSGKAAEKRYRTMRGAAGKAVAQTSGSTAQGRARIAIGTAAAAKKARQAHRRMRDASSDSEELSEDELALSVECEPDDDDDLDADDAVAVEAVAVDAPSAPPTSAKPKRQAAAQARQSMSAWSQRLGRASDDEDEAPRSGRKRKAADHDHRPQLRAASPVGVATVEALASDEEGDVDDATAVGVAMVEAVAVASDDEAADAMLVESVFVMG